MKASRRWIVGLLLCLAGTVLADPVTVQGLRLWAEPGATRVVFDVSGPVQHELFVLKAPDRVVVDLRDAKLAPGAGEPGPQGRVRGIRSAARNGSDLRLVLDLNGPVKPRSLLLQPDAEHGHRLVIDLHTDSPAAAAQPMKPSMARSEPAAVKTRRDLPAGRDLVIAIDAGHGGADPGARGPSGIREKDVVLAIARKLAALVAREPGMRPVLIRDGDHFIRLRERMQRARDQRADLFVSIHADAFHDRRARGSSVFVVSERGASSEMARILADQENAADLVGGVSLNDKDDLLKSVLLDLSKAASIEASLNVADNVLGELKQVGRVHKHKVQQAGFMVLKSPDVPSILVETAFISNPEEERQLRDPRHQQRLAQAVMNGLRAYFRNNPPPGTLMAAREHVIRRGDTLSEIARRYAVSPQQLRLANGLSGDMLRVGGVLRIPGEDS
ncbi:MAG: N-acetylmuramoyl-L-alanine amidase [Gammaproteobacteria bacterium]